ncbi:MAG TPA: CC/Se motif family (seleno)protein [Bacillota bacterium]|nr:CC/Se motif family (seleno)protein [Bacillota bacterium]HQE67611.1 CC/Se motif family (seleno)protein [Bacillota bacterium]HQH33973.1 CC/Se motif family (seleno)protein [Petrotogaceae bacterium]HQL36848.1 CC/Se motif family (seleno)protein [Bacillota bacterium]
MHAPTVQLGKPDKTENFDLYSVDGVDAYIKKGTRVLNDQIHIFLRKFLWIKDLAVDGIRVDY